jgi:LuxR family transcriptional regulator, quorum-sensing system regulator SdiA
MTKGMKKVEELRGFLAQLGDHCDTGFALAIHIRFTRPSLLFRTYRQDWIEHYSEKGFMLTDPVVHWGIMNAGEITWDDLAPHDTGGVLADAKRFGLTNGWTYSVGEMDSRTISGLTKSGAPFTEADRKTLRAIVDKVHALTDGIENFDPEVLEAMRAL